MNRPDYKYEKHLDSKEARWFAIYTPYKREKLVCRQLQKKGIEAYLPVKRVVRRYTRKIIHVELPLISCYVFVKIVEREYLNVLETEQVLNFVKFAENLIAIPEEEMKLMKRVLGEGIEVNAERKNYMEGDRVEVLTGNLVGTQGRLCHIKGKKQFLVDLDFLGYTLQINMDPILLRKIESGVSI